jgi:hypothetical protein
MDVFSDSISDAVGTRRTTRLLLLAIIVLTLPCYCLGFVLLAYAPADETESTAAPTNATLGGITSTPFFTATYTPFGLTATPTQASGPLLATPGQIYLPTNTPFVWPTPTLTLTPTSQPTGMPTLTEAPTLTPTLTLIPTSLPPDTEAPLPTDEPVATDTLIPTVAPTEGPPTVAPLPTDEPVPTPTQEITDKKTESLPMRM